METRAKPSVDLSRALRAAAEHLPEDRPKRWLLLLAAEGLDARVAWLKGAARRPLAWCAVLLGAPVGGVALSYRL